VGDLLESMQAVVQTNAGQERAEAGNERMQRGGRLGSEARAVQRICGASDCRAGME
jgi:hypothetical protein